MPPKTARRIVLVDHHENPTDDRASTHLEKRGYELVRRYPVNGDKLILREADAHGMTHGMTHDLTHNLAGTVLYGGLHNVDQLEKYPFLHDEIAWIRHCHAHAIPMLGICLGAQLIAHALGAQVMRMAKGRCEFGYYRITPTAAGKLWMPQPLYVPQAHFYQFDLPLGATRLARGENCETQAFRYGQHTYALQFHPEVTPDIFTRWQNAEWAFFHSPGAQTRAQQDALSANHDADQHAWFVDFLDKLFEQELVSSKPPA